MLDQQPTKIAPRPKLSLDTTLVLIDEALERSRVLLSDTAVMTPTMAGWRQFLGKSDQIGTYGTACGLIAYCHLAPEDERLINQISGSLASLQASDGSWDSPTIYPGVGLTTATAYATIALRTAGMSSSTETAKRAASWLTSLSTPDGGVGHFVGDSQPKIIASALTFRALAVLDATLVESTVASLFRFLNNAQNNDGGFGSEPGKESTLHHTAEVVIALASSGVGRRDARHVLERAMIYIEGHWSLGDNLHRDISYVEHSGRRAMLPHTYQTDGLLLQSRMALWENTLDSRTVELVQWILDSQQNGYWLHRSIPDKIPAWALMETVVGLKNFKRKVENNQRLLSLEYSLGQIDERLTTLESSTIIIQKHLEMYSRHYVHISSLYRYRYVLVVLYLASIYLFLRTNFGMTQPVADIIAVGLGFVLCALQLLAALKSSNDSAH